jgi:hypothetical protein
VKPILCDALAVVHLGKIDDDILPRLLRSALVGQRAGIDILMDDLPDLATLFSVSQRVDNGCDRSYRFLSCH